MSVYAIAFLRYKDAAAYQRYSDALAPMLPAYGAVLLVGDNHPSALVGPTCDRVVLLRFEDKAAALSLFESPEYLRIAKDRDLGAYVELQLVQGAG
ncbi:DUF1330 domain-containing protein [Caenimonas terrae]|uniref:DUF1330 domain-containing protein n=1 Tax=Caenimonas terrae TaxID=696074 RepID=A0ABW0NH69_9BURK